MGKKGKTFLGIFYKTVKIIFLILILILRITFITLPYEIYRIIRAHK